MENEIYQKIVAELGEQVMENVSLKDYTTFKIGGPAEFLIEVTALANLKKAYQVGQQLGLQVTVLGGCSNVLIADEGIKGLVIINKTDDLNIGAGRAEVASGYNLTKLSKDLATAGWSGLEFAAGIYGTIGGAVVGNAGAYGGEISQVVVKVEVLTPNNEIKLLENSDLKFNYRSSIFKTGYEGIITRIWLKLFKEDPEKIKKFVEDKLSDRQQKEQEKFPSAGCVFRNVPFDEVNLDEVRNKGVEVEKFKEIKKIPAGYLIASLDLRGKKMGGAMVSKEHGNFIFNVGEAKAVDIIMLISYLKQQVRDNYGIQLQEEIKLLGF